MKRGYRHLRWSALALAMIFSLLLMLLEAFVFQPTSATASVNSGKVVSSGSLGAGIARMLQPWNVGDGMIKIMPLGDSITYGQGSTNGGGYRWPLWNELHARGAQVTFVGSMQHGPAGPSRDNEGLPGWTINQIAARAVGWLQAYQPRIILLHIGTNDFLKHDDPANAPARLKSLIDLITSTLPDATLIVAQIIPITRIPRLNAAVVSYNQTIPGIVLSEVARGKHVLFVDMYHAVSPSLLIDGVHPGNRAYTLMAQVWANALFPLLKLRN